MTLLTETEISSNHDSFKAPLSFPNPITREDSQTDRCHKHCGKRSNALQYNTTTIMKTSAETSSLSVSKYWTRIMSDWMRAEQSKVKNHARKQYKHLGKVKWRSCIKPVKDVGFFFLSFLKGDAQVFRLGGRNNAKWHYIDRIMQCENVSYAETNNIITINSIQNYTRNMHENTTDVYLTHDNTDFYKIDVYRLSDVLLE